MSTTKHTPGPRIALRLSPHGNACLMCDTEDARFHMWLDPSSLLPVDGVVYKNPANEDFRVRTIRLDMRRGIGKQVADLMLPQVHELYADAKGVLDQQLAEEKAAAEAERLRRAAEAAAPEMLAALIAIRDAEPSGRSWTAAEAAARELMLAAITKATGSAA